MEIKQGKEYIFVANSDNLGAIVDLSILLLAYSSVLSILRVSFLHIMLIFFYIMPLVHLLLGLMPFYKPQ